MTTVAVRRTSPFTIMEGRNGEKRSLSGEKDASTSSGDLKRRKCNEGVLAAGENTPVTTIERDENSRFWCPTCSVYCSRDEHAFVAHTQWCSGNVNDATVFLSNYNWRVEVSVRLVICLTCRFTIDPNKPSGHLKNSHSKSPGVAFDREFQTVVGGAYGELLVQPVFPVEAIDHIDGLDECDDVQFCASCNCGFCGQDGSRTKKNGSFRKHGCHERDRSVTFTIGHGQCLGRSKGWIKTRPKPTLPPSFTVSPWTRFMAQRKDDELRLLPSVPDDDRVLTPFLRNERWLDHVSNLDAASGAELIQCTDTKTIYAKVIPRIHAYCASIQGRIHSYPLRRLVGSRPASEHEHQFERHHRDVGYDAHRKYSGHLAGALSLLLRTIVQPHDKYRFQVPREVADLGRKLLELLEGLEHADDQYLCEVRASVGGDAGLDPFDDDGGDEEDEEEEGGDEEGKDGSLFPAYGPGERRKVPEYDDEVQDVLRDLLWSIYGKRYPEFTSGHCTHLLTRFLILSSRLLNGRWKQPCNITQPISGLLHIGRLVVADHVLEWQEATGEEGLSGAYARFEKVLKEYDLGIIPQLYLLKRSLSAIRSADQSTILFNSPSFDGQCVTMLGKNIYLNDMRLVHEDLLDDIREKMDKILWGRFQLDEDAIIQDDPRCLDPFYGFATDSRNAWSQNPNPVLCHMLKTHWDEIGQKALWGADEGDPRSSIFDRLWNHSYWGEPGRGTEYASMLYTNVPAGTVRNVMWLNGVLVIRGGYNKSTSATGEDRTMTRVPLPGLGRLVARFLAYVRPLFIELQGYFRPEMASNARTFLFAGLYRPVRAADLSHGLGMFMTSKLGICLPLSKLRQYMSYLTKWHHPLFTQIQVLNDSASEQLGHAGLTERAHYGAERNLPPGMDLLQFIRTTATSAIIHVIFGHPPDLLAHVMKRTPHLEALRRRIEGVIHGEGHGSRATSMLPSSLSIDVSVLSEELKQTLIPPIVNSHVRALVEAVASASEPRPALSVDAGREIYPHPSILEVLREMYGDRTETLGFKTKEQAVVSHLMLTRETNILYISPTGSGKTTPGLLCSKLDEGLITVWILPLRSMHEQYRARFTALRMPFVVWEPGHPEHTVRFSHLLLSIEMAVWDKVDEYLGRLVHEERIARIIVDEAHLALTHEGFRSVMQLLDHYGSKGVQIVLMTATLPPSLEGALKAKFGITRCYVSRTVGPRANISFNVLRARPTESMSMLLVKTYQMAIDASLASKVLIFSRSKDQAERIGRQLGIPFCTANDTPEDIDKKLTGLRSGTIRGLSCTSILGVALHIAGLTHVIHYDYPYNSLSFVQEVGRAGRSDPGEKAWSIVIVPETPGRLPSPDRFGTRLLQIAIDNRDYCRRLLIQYFLDGVAEPCTGMAGVTHWCDVCRTQSRTLRRQGISFPFHLYYDGIGDSDAVRSYLARTEAITSVPMLSAQAASKKTYQKRVERTERDRRLENIEGLISQLASGCFACWTSGASSWVDHLFRDCEKVCHDEFEQWRKKSWVKSKGYCWTCGCPQSVNYMDDQGQRRFIHPFNEGQSQSCPTDGVFLPLRFLASKAGSVPQDKIDRHLKSKGLDIQMSYWLELLASEGVPNLFLALEFLDIGRLN